MILFKLLMYKVRLNRSQRDRLEPSFGATLEEAPRWPQTPGATPRGRGGEGGGGGGKKHPIWRTEMKRWLAYKVLCKNRKKCPFQCCFKSNFPGHTAKAAQIQATFCTSH